jgi:hypothetical protein
LADNNGCIWSTYGDEEAISKEGSSALVRLDNQGEKQWGFNENRGEAKSVWTFYALNVDEDVVWACGYTKCEVVQIKDDQVRRWQGRIGGVEELAVGDSYVLMLGPYHRGDLRFWLGRLGHSDVEAVEEVLITLPDGRFLRDLEHPLEQHGVPQVQRRREYGFRIIGRHNALHVFAEDQWFQITVEDVAAAQLKPSMAATRPRDISKRGQG